MNSVLYFTFTLWGWLFLCSMWCLKYYCGNALPFAGEGGNNIANRVQGEYAQQHVMLRLQPGDWMLSTLSIVPMKTEAVSASRAVFTCFQVKNKTEEG